MKLVGLFIELWLATIVIVPLTRPFAMALSSVLNGIVIPEWVYDQKLFNFLLVLHILSV